MTDDYRLQRPPLHSGRKAQAQTDPVTGLYDRRGFLQRALQEQKRSLIAGQSCALFFIEVASLQQIKDRFGSDEGEAVEVAVGGCLKSSFRAGDVAGRLACGEFAVLAPGCNNPLRPHARLQSRMNHYTDLFPRPYPFSIRVRARDLSQRTPAAA